MRCRAKAGLAPQVIFSPFDAEDKVGNFGARSSKMRGEDAAKVRSPRRYWCGREP